MAIVILTDQELIELTGRVRVFFIFAAVICSGCASKAEIAWQSLHAIDGLQTLEIARDDCYEEQFPITRALIGKHPEPAGVVAWWAATAAGHAWVSSKLDGKWLKAWQAITIIGTASAVNENHSIGIRIGTRNRWEDSGGRCDYE